MRLRGQYTEKELRKQSLSLHQRGVGEKGQDQAVTESVQKVSTTAFQYQ